MTEKDNVSMATVQLKPDYAASEVYSTASEPPPVSKRDLKTVSKYNRSSIWLSISLYM